MRLRLCLPCVTGRGAGLGNELVPWARAFLMAQVLGARALPPAFGLNPRGYHHHFGGSRLDWLGHRLLRAGLPTVHFGHADHLAHGGGDVRQSFQRYAQAQGLARRGAMLVTTDGMWGGFDHIAAARDFVRATLYASRHARTNLAALGARLDPDQLTVAMHVRLGDFTAAAADAVSYRNRFNCALPLEWFIDAGRQLREALGERVQFQVFSDGTAEQLSPLTKALGPVSTQAHRPADVSDLLAMSQADLLMCSVSSYSAWAAFLSAQPYVWFAPQLEPVLDGWGAIWAHEPTQRQAGSVTQQALATRRAEPRSAPAGRGIALMPGATLPDALLTDLDQRWAQRRPSADLVRYGVVRIEPPSGMPHAINVSHERGTMSGVE